MTSAFLSYGQSLIHYLQYGKGKTIIIALHGYGEAAISFTCLEKYFSQEYYVIAIDLPYHGSTKWKEERAFTVADMICIIEKILNELSITASNFILMGYSMGGRLALSITENLPAKVSRLLLLAPDGMTVNFWYWLATQTRTGNQLFLHTMNNPKWFFRVLRIANTFKLINRSIYKFIFNYIDDEKVRNELFNRWTCMRKIKPDLKKIRSIIEERKLPVRMLYGKHDRIIRPKRSWRLRKGVEAYCHVHVIETGHRILLEKHAVTITKLLIT